MENLTSVDFMLLEYINKHEPVSKTNIEKNLKVDSLDYRLKILKTPEYRNIYGASFPVDDTAYIHEDYETYKDDDTCITHHKHLDIYSLSRLGRKTLQDYNESIKTEQKRRWLENAWIPILVTIATNLIIGGLKWLFPLIQQLFPNGAQ